MKRVRKHPRINLRFKDHYTMNEFEVAALQQGLSLPAWIKKVISDELTNIDKAESLKEAVDESILIIRKHVENKKSEEEKAFVRDYVKSHIEKVKSYAARRS